MPRWGGTAGARAASLACAWLRGGELPEIADRPDREEHEDQGGRAQADHVECAEADAPQVESEPEAQGESDVQGKERDARLGRAEPAVAETEAPEREGLEVSAGGYHHHVGMNVWRSRGGPPAPPGTTGLHRFTLAFPDEDALGTAVEWIAATGTELVELDGGGALLSDPDAIAVELSVGQPGAD